MIRRPELRALIDQRVRPATTDEEWRWLGEHGYLDPYLNPDPVADIVTVVEDARQTFAGGASAAGDGQPDMLDPAWHTKGLETTTREQALSLLVWREASSEPDVVAFRRDQLEEGLLKPERQILKRQIDVWAGLDDEPAVWLKDIPLAEERLRASDDMRSFYAQPSLVLSADTPAFGFEQRLLEWRIPGGRAWSHIAISENGILSRLASVSRYLSGKYCWEVGQSTTFVLTGLVPIIAHASFDLKEPLHGGPVGLTRISAEYDLALSPERVAELHRRYRRQFVKTFPRSLSQKSLSLAVFVAYRPDGESWEFKTQRWNSKFADRPGWAYPDRRNFKRDFEAVRKRLLEPGYQLEPELGDQNG